MSNPVQVYNNPQFGDVRIVTDANNEPLFCLADVCKALELGNPSQVKTRLKPNGIQLIDYQGVITNEGVKINELRKTTANFINEPNLYKCIFQSRKAEAEKFQDWIFEEVLPAIRKTGTYSVPQVSNNPLLQEAEVQLYLLREIANDLRINDTGRLGMYQAIAGQHNLPLPAYVHSKGVHRSASELLKEIGSDMSARKFNGLLEEAGYIERKTRPSSKGGTKAFWVITLKGEPYGENCVSPNNPNETQPHWYEDRFRSLYEIVTNP